VWIGFIAYLQIRVFLGSERIATVAWTDTQQRIQVETNNRVAQARSFGRIG
jgi:hypothetical protein